MAFIFLVAYHFLFTMYIQISRLQFILHLYSLFVLFYPLVEVLCCRPKYWANIIHRYNDQNSLTSKCIETGLYLKDLRTASDWRYRYPPAPPGVCPTQSPRKPALFGPVQGCDYKHLSALSLTLEKILVSRGEAQPFEKFTPAERPENSL